MQYSKNFNLKLPQPSDNARVEDLCENFEAIDSELSAAGNKTAAATSADGVTYTVTVPGLTTLAAGMAITIVPNMESTDAAVRLVVNEMEESKAVVLKGSGSTGSTAVSGAANWLRAGKPILLRYDGSVWVADLQQVDASEITGVVSIEHGGHGGKTAEEARKNLGITPANIGAQPKVNGAASTVTDANLTGSRVLVSNGNGKISVSKVTSGEVEHLSGVTGNVQTQLNEKAADTHSHDASNIETGILPVSRGGLGVGDLETFAINIGMARVAKGTYVGTNEYGSSKKNTLTFEFTPQFVYIVEDTADEGLSFVELLLFRGIATTCAREVSGYASSDTVQKHVENITWSENTVSWYNTKSAADQLNTRSKTYYYLAIG